MARRTAPEAGEGEAVESKSEPVFGVHHNGKPVFTSTDEDLCKHVANSRKAALVAQGVDVTDKVHAIEVKPMETTG